MGKKKRKSESLNAPKSAHDPGLFTDEKPTVRKCGRSQSDG